ncbi:hypothetical protein D3C73_1069260 [compost metagenome]
MTTTLIAVSAGPVFGSSAAGAVVLLLFDVGAGEPCLSLPSVALLSAGAGVVPLLVVPFLSSGASVGVVTGPKIGTCVCAISPLLRTNNTEPTSASASTTATIVNISIEPP